MSQNPYRVPESLPYGGLYRSHQGFRAALAAFAAAWTGIETRDLTFTDSGDTVIALSLMMAQATTTGRPFQTHVAETFRVTGGKIVEVRPFYFDTAAMIAALG